MTRISESPVTGRDGGYCTMMTVTASSCFLGLRAESPARAGAGGPGGALIGARRCTGSSAKPEPKRFWPGSVYSESGHTEQAGHDTWLCHLGPRPYAPSQWRPGRLAAAAAPPQAWELFVFFAHPAPSRSLAALLISGRRRTSIRVIMMIMLRVMHWQAGLPAQ